MVVLGTRCLVVPTTRGVCSWYRLRRAKAIFRTSTAPKDRGRPFEKSLGRKKKVVVHHYQNQRDEVLAQQRNIAIFQRDTKTCNPVSILFEGSVLTPARVFRLVQSINAQTSKDYLAKMHTDLDFVSEALGKDAPRFSKGG